MKGIMHTLDFGGARRQVRIADGHALPEHAAYLGVHMGRSEISACDCDACLRNGADVEPSSGGGGERPR